MVSTQATENLWNPEHTVFVQVANHKESVACRGGVVVGDLKSAETDEPGEQVVTGLSFESTMINSIETSCTSFALQL